MLTSLAISLVVGQAAPATAVTLGVTETRTVQGMRPLAFAPAPSGSLFAATMEDKTVRIINAATRETVRTFEGHPVPAYAVAWSDDGAFLATGDESARIFIWDARTGQKLREMRTHIRGIQNLSFNHPRTLLVSTGKDDVIKIYDVSSGKEVKSIPGQGVNFYGATFMGKSNNFGTGILGYGARVYNAQGVVTGFLTGHEGQGVFEIDFNRAGTLAGALGSKRGEAPELPARPQRSSHPRKVLAQR
jgi:WD40 repeat protein